MTELKPVNPYPQRISDDAFGVLVINRDWKCWEEGKEAALKDTKTLIDHWRELLCLAQTTVSPQSHIIVRKVIHEIIAYPRQLKHD